MTGRQTEVWKTKVKGIFLQLKVKKKHVFAPSLESLKPHFLPMPVVSNRTVDVCVHHLSLEKVGRSCVVR